MSKLFSSHEQLVTRSSYWPWAACLIGLAAYWAPYVHVIGSCDVGQYANAARVVVLFLLGMCGGLLQWKKISLFGAAGLLGGWGIDIVLSLNLPTIFHCSHQLLPFEALLLYAVTACASWLGFSFGKLLTRHLDISPGTWLTVAYGLALMSCVIALLSSTLLPLELRSKEQKALENVKMLVQGQYFFRSSHPEIGFSCRLSELTDNFSKAWPSTERDKKYESAFEGGYSYRLWCLQEASRAKFSLEAFPNCVPVCGNVGYCVNESGTVKSLSRDTVPSGKDWSRLCWDSGVTVTSILP